MNRKKKDRRNKGRNEDKKGENELRKTKRKK